MLPDGPGDAGGAGCEVGRWHRVVHIISMTPLIDTRAMVVGRSPEGTARLAVTVTRSRGQ